MPGIPPALPNDLEDVVWALQTAESLWKRGERVDAVVWVRRAAQAAGEGDDAKRAAVLGRHAADLGDWIGSHTVTGTPAKVPEPPPPKPKPKPKGPDLSKRLGKKMSMEQLDKMFGDSSSPPALQPQKKAPPPQPLAREESQAFVLSVRDVEIVSARDFEAGFGEPPPKAPAAKSEAPKGTTSDASEVMEVSVHAGDVEIVDDDVTDADGFPEEELTPVKHVKSPLPPAQTPTAAQAHVGMLDPWSEAEGGKAKEGARAKLSSSSRFEEDDEVVTSARSRNVAEPPPANIPGAPRAPSLRGPRASSPEIPPAPPSPVEEDEVETTTYRQVNPRQRSAESPAREPPRPQPGARPKPPVPTSVRAPAAPEKPKPPPPEPRPRAPSLPTFEGKGRPAAPEPKPPPVASKPPSPAPSIGANPPPPAEPARASSPPALDLLELVDSVSFDEPEGPSATTSPPEPAASVDAITAAPPQLEAIPETITAHPAETITSHPETGAAVSEAPPSPHPSAMPTPAPTKGSVLPASARPTAPPPESVPMPDIPPVLPLAPGAAAAILDLDAVEALGDLPDDAREAFARAARIHGVAIEEEVSHFALALVVDGDIDVSATIVDAPALRLTKNAVLRSRGTLVPGVGLRLVCNSQKATIATWDDAAVAEAFRTCPWVEEDLRAVADRVQACAGVTMGPLGERFDMALREHLTSKLTLRALAPGEVLVAAGKPVGILLVGIGDVVITKAGGARSGAAGPGDFIFPMQTMTHGAAPETATAGPGGAVVLTGDRATAQELLMTFPPLLEVLATL